MRWGELDRYRIGQTDAGDPRFKMPLEADEDGMVGRECPHDDCSPRYFKIAPRQSQPEESSQQTAAPDSLVCPYCGRQDGFQQFITAAQREWLKSLIVRDITREFHRVIGDALRPARSGGLFSITYKRGALPPVRLYQEQELKRTIQCDQCSGRYAVYGVTAYCPLCGSGSLCQHLQRSVEIVTALLGLCQTLRETGGRDVEYHQVCNCLEDCVSLFEGLLRKVYTLGLAAHFSVAEQQRKLGSLRNAFQNAGRAEAIFRGDFGWELFATIDAADRSFLELQLAKRHVITHNLGLVDDRFRAQMNSWQRPGQDVDVTADDVRRLLTLIDNVLSRSIAGFER